MIEGSDGNFYDTTHAGGEFGSETSAGTAFMITPSGTLTTLYSFCSQEDPNNPTDCLDGAEPDAGVIEGSDGNFYGATAVGGANGDFGFGTAFKLSVSFPTPVSGNLTISPGQHSFGRTVIGTTHHQTFVVRAYSRTENAVPIVLESFTIRGGGDYSVDPTLTTCQQAQMLENNQKCEIVVDFTPAMATKQLTDTGTLIVTSNAEEVRPKHGVVTLKGGGKASEKRK